MRSLLTICFAICLAFALATPAQGQILSLSRDELIELTKLNPDERFPDGRPNIPDALLERMAKLSIEEAWGVLRGEGYVRQFAGDFQILHPGKTLVGRAVTAQYLPLRPDLKEFVDADAKAKGMSDRTTQKVIDVLQKGDIPVVDLMGAAPGHNFGGDNLAAAIYGATGKGAVVDGTIRDLQGTHDLPTQIYFRKPHPSAVTGVVVVGINIPVHIGHAAVLPGDVVLGDRTGVIFIPPHLVEKVLDRADLIHIKDDWTKNKFLTGKHKASDLYGGPLSPELQKEYDAYKKKRLAEIQKAQ